MIADFASLGTLRSLRILITSANGMIEIAEIPASMICSFATFQSPFSPAFALLKAYNIAFARSANEPYVGSNQTTSNAA